MASPTVLGTPATTSNQSAGTTTPINLPAGISAGELLIAFVASKAGTGEAQIAGWTRFLDARLAQGSTATIHGFWRVADGSESATVDLTTTTSTRVAAVVYRTDASTSTPPEAATAGAANSNTPDPPSLAPTGGSQDYLWFALFASSHGRITSAVPASYGGSQTAGDNSGTATHIGIGVAHRALTAASEDPGTFTTTGTGVEETIAATVAVYPATSGHTMSVGQATESNAATGSSPLAGTVRRDHDHGTTPRSQTSQQVSRGAPDQTVSRQG